MKKFLMALVILAITGAPALAGPNASGILVVHNTGLLASGDPPVPTPVPACADIVNTIPMGADPGVESQNLVWKVYAAFPLDADPRLKGVAFGVHSSEDGAGGIIISGNWEGAIGPMFFQTSTGWPGNGLLGTGTFVGLSFTDSVRTTPVTELWVFQGHAYAGEAGEPQMFCLIPDENTENRVFLDDAVPQNPDPVAGYGCLGFGQAGYTPPCPTGVVTGACCFTTGLYHADDP